MRKKWGFALIVTAAMLTAACGSEKPAEKAPEKPKQSAVKADVKQPCSLLPDKEFSTVTKVKQVRAETLPEKTTPENHGTARTCSYAEGSRKLGALAVTTYEGNPITPKAMIDGLKAKKPGAEDIAGVADATYYVDKEHKSAVAAAAKVVNGTPVLIGFSGPETVKREELVELVKRASSKV